jgi:hypothetical protein
MQAARERKAGGERKEYRGSSRPQRGTGTPKQQRFSKNSPNKGRGYKKREG